MSHPDSTYKNMMWPAKLGVSPRIQAQVEKKWPGGFVPILMDENGEYVSSVVDLLNVIDPPPASEVVEEAQATPEDFTELSDTGSEEEAEGKEVKEDEENESGAE